MIIPNKLIKLDYDPAKDILLVEWPDFDYYALGELNQILDNIVDTVRHYDINYLMVDSRTTVVAISDADYSKIAHRFAQNLIKTRLKKVARLSTDDLKREKLVTSLKVETKLSVDFQSFETVEDAMQWFAA